MPSDRERSKHRSRSHDRCREREGRHSKEKSQERGRTRSRSARDSDDKPDEFIPTRHDHERAKTKNRRKEYSHYYVDTDAPQSERKWSLNKRSGKYSNNLHDLEDRERTAKGNRAAVRDLDRHGVAHRDFAYSTSSPGHWRSDQRYANDDHLCREPESYRDGPQWSYIRDIDADRGRR